MNGNHNHLPLQTIRDICLEVAHTKHGVVYGVYWKLSDGSTTPINWGRDPVRHTEVPDSDFGDDCPPAQD